MSKLGIVTKHEYLTIVRQPSFWIVMLAIPLVIAVIQLIAYVGATQSEQRIQELSKELTNVAIVDKSGLINADIVRGAGLDISDPAQAEAIREQVRTGTTEALVVYPADIKESKKYQIYLSTDDLTKSGSVTSLASTLLETSIYAPLGSTEIIALAQNGGEAQLTTYRDGRETAGFNEYVIPGLIVILFFMIFFFSVGYMLSSVAEEKENRSMEMVLTYVNSKTLILGKLLAVILVTLTQLAFFALLILIAFAVFTLLGNSLSLPAGIELSKIVFDPMRIFFGLGFLFAGFMMYAGFMTITAAAAPTSREANSFSSIFFIGAFSPFWIFMLILTDPGNTMTKFATFFPLTAPATALLRNAVGNMGVVESTLSLASMTVFAILSIWLAVKVFRLGALEFSSRIKIKSLLTRS